MVEKSYEELVEANPCVGCPAPCCRMLLWPQTPPQSLKEIDHLRYILLFQQSELTITNAGEWSIVKWQTCTLFEEKSCTCTVHTTSKQPLICKEFSPYQCWYKNNFVANQPFSNLLRLNIKRFELWLKHVSFDETGLIVSFPSFEEAKAIIEKASIQPIFQLNPKLTK